MVGPGTGDWAAVWAANEMSATAVTIRPPPSRVDLMPTLPVPIQSGEVLAGHIAPQEAAISLAAGVAAVVHDALAARQDHVRSARHGAALVGRVVHVHV